MKILSLILSMMLLGSFNLNAQFKGLNLKRVSNFDKPIKLRAYAITAPKQQLHIYSLDGKIPGKADAGFITHDATDKHSFLILARYWNREKKLAKDDEFALKYYAREFTPPKGYDGVVIDEKFITEKEGVIYVRKYARAFNEKEQDTVSMTEVTYVSKHPSLHKEVIAFDLIMIGDDIEIKPAVEVAKLFIENIKPLNVFYDKKWNVITEVNIITGNTTIKTNLSYVTKWQANNKAYFGTADFNPTATAGPAIFGSRHIYRNLWLKLGAGLYTGVSNDYDSLYNTKEIDLGYFTQPLLYNVKLNSSDFHYLSLGFEQRFQLNGRNSIIAFINYKQSFGENKFTMVANDMITGQKNTYVITYDNPSGFDFGAKYQHCFKYHHWGFNGGFGYTYTQYKTKNYTRNGVSESISTSPYFLSQLNTLKFEGLMIVVGAFWQF